MDDQLTNTGPSTGGGAGKKVLWVILVLILIGGAGYGTYYWQQQQITKLNNQITALNSQVTSLNTQVTSLNAQLKKATANQNVVKITTLGIELTVPDSIKDLTYSPTTGTTTANLSTASLTKADSACSATSASPLGIFTKVSGQFPTTGTPPGKLVKQFTSYYISWTSPQATCSTNTTTQALATAQLQVIQTTFGTVTAIN
jgi:hypothetical protein